MYQLSLIKTATLQSLTPGKRSYRWQLAAINLFAPCLSHSLNNHDSLALTQHTEVRVLLKGIFLTGCKAANGHSLLIDTLQVVRIKPVTFQLQESLSNHVASIPAKSFAPDPLGTECEYAL